MSLTWLFVSDLFIFSGHRFYTCLVGGNKRLQCSVTSERKCVMLRNSDWFFSFPSGKTEMHFVEIFPLGSFVVKIIVFYWLPKNKWLNCYIIQISKIIHNKYVFYAQLLIFFQTHTENNTIQNIFLEKNCYN